MKKVENELEAGIPFEDYRYKSICRVNVLKKSS